jgi:hypothetical protein
MSDGTMVAGLTEPEQLYELHGLDRGLSGHFELLGERDGFMVVRPVTNPPRPDRQMCLLLRFRDALIVEMRDFANAQAAMSYAGITQ